MELCAFAVEVVVEVVGGSALSPIVDLEMLVTALNKRIAASEIRSGI